MFSRKNPVQKVTTKSKFYPAVFPYFSYAASSRQSETYQNIHGRFLANLASIYLRERRQKKDCWKFPSQSLHKHLENFSIKSLAFRRNIRGKRTNERIIFPGCDGFISSIHVKIHNTFIDTRKSI